MHFFVATLNHMVLKCLWDHHYIKKNELISYTTWTNLCVLNPQNHAREPHEIQWGQVQSAAPGSEQSRAEIQAGQGMDLEQP